MTVTIFNHFYLDGQVITYANLRPRSALESVILTVDRKLILHQEQVFLKNKFFLRTSYFHF